MNPKQQANLARCIGQAYDANAAGRHEDAMKWCRKALDIAPGLPEAWYHLGQAHAGLGRVRQATDALARAAELGAGNADALNSIGLQLLRLGAHAQAERCLLRCLALAPTFAFAHSNLGLLRQRQGRPAEAVAAFHQALACQPRLAAVQANLAGALNDLGNHAAAEAACRLALEIDPQLPVAWGNLGNALAGLQRTEEAQAACRKALELDPSLPEPHTVLAGLLVASGRIDEALAEYGRAIEANPLDLEARSSRLFCLNYSPDATPAQVLAAAREYDEVASRRAIPFTSWDCTPERERKLRIGLVSGDFRRHPVGYLLRGPLRELDREAFEVVAYSNHAWRDEVTEELRSRCAAWHEVAGLGDAALARQVHDERIDILVDLAGHTNHGRLPLFAWKPAPVQASWLGYFATTGLRAIDWRIGDPWVTPAHEEDQFTERIWRLPGTCFSFSPPPEAPPVAPPPCLANGFVTYGCFNNLAKLNDRVVEAWSRLLLADPSARLFLKAKPLADAAMRSGLEARFARHGIAPQRLLLEGHSARGDYLASYGRVDIGLDPFPYSGGMTTAESLWMGVPVVTLRGERYIAHQGESQLHAAGLAEWIAADLQAYVGIALAAAAAPDRLAATRATLREKAGRSPLFDAPRQARQVEAAWRGLWSHWCHAR